MWVVSHFGSWESSPMVTWWPLRVTASTGSVLIGTLGAPLCWLLTGWDAPCRAEVGSQGWLAWCTGFRIQPRNVITEVFLVKLPSNELSLDLTDDRLTLILVMAWCHKATSHYLSQCWPSSMSPYDIIWPQWVNSSPPSNIIWCLINGSALVPAMVVTSLRDLWVKLWFAYFFIWNNFTLYIWVFIQ